MRNSTEIKYRDEIDSLRAVAVLGVMIYHFAPSLAPGGYLGVDLFFVISGYVITRSLSNSTGSWGGLIRRFYIRRVARILPLLTLVVFFLMAAGFLLLTPIEFLELGRQIIGSLLFYSNFYYLQLNSYFAIEANGKPLLHTWSLSIEQVFYLIFPIAFFFSLKTAKWTIVILFLGSLCSYLFLAVISSKNNEAFFRTDSRVWEILAGSLLVYGQQFCNEKKFAISDRVAPIVSAICFLIIFTCFGLITSSGSFAVYAPLVIVSSGILLIHFLGAEHYFTRISSSYPPRYIGLRSYGLYLWHWPIFVFLGTYWPEYIPPSVRLLALCGVFLISEFSYRFVELPAKSYLVSNPNGIRHFAFAYLIIFSTAVLIVWQKGFPGRYSVVENSLATYATLKYNISNPSDHRILDFNGKNHSPCWLKEENDFEVLIKNGCLKIGEKKETILLLGDSHSDSLSQGLRPAITALGIHLQQASIQGCFTMLPNEPRERCKVLSQRLRRFLKQNPPKLIVLNLNYAGFTKRFGNYDQIVASALDTIRAIEEIEGVNVLIVGQVPTWKRPLPELVLDHYRQKHEIPNRLFNAVNEDSVLIDPLLASAIKKSTLKKSIYISLRDHLCTAEGCKITVGDNVAQDLIVWDRSHLTLSGSIFISNLLMPKISEIFRVTNEENKQ